MLEQELNDIFVKANDFALEHHHEYISIEHIFYMMIKNEKIHNFLDKYQVNFLELDYNLKEHFKQNYVQENSTNSPYETVSLSRVVDNMLKLTKAQGKENADVFDMLRCILKEKNSYVVFLLKHQGVDIDELFNVVENKNEELEKYTINLLDLAKKGKIDPLIGRQDEVNRMIQILCRRKKNNPLLVGEPGVGKTAIVEGLALAIYEQKIPNILKDASLYALDIGSILAGTKYRGDFEKRLKSIINELENIPNSIIFIDEIHTIVGAGSTSGSSVDLSNLLKPSLASGNLRCIGATTYAEFRHFTDKDKALARRFAKIDIDEPSVDDAYEILKGLRQNYEKHHDVKYPDEVLKTCVTLAKKYLRDRFLPDSAIDLIDEVGASFRLGEDKHNDVKIGDIENTLSKITNVPSKQINSDDTKLLKNLDKELKSIVFGQDEAIEALALAIKRSRAGLGKPNSPIGAFLFAGPTGVGKTEVAKALSNVLGVHFERFDMSEYMEKHSISRLIGAPPGYVGFEGGGQLTEAIKKHPYSVLLLDEIEKAHVDLLNILLQVFDSATLTDNNGVKTDFSNVIVIMTSNLGTKEASQVGFAKNSEFKADNAIKDFFAPEFRNRLDTIVHFKPLSTDIMELIVQKLLDEISLLLGEKNIKIKASKKAKQYLANKGYSDTLGARVMQRVIASEVKSPLTDEILFGKLKNGGVVKIDLVNEKLHFKYE